MPLYDIECPECGIGTRLVSLGARKLAGCGRDQAPCRCGAVARIIPCAPAVHVFGSQVAVKGLKGEFSSFREVEKAAAAQGMRIETEEEKEDRAEMIIMPESRDRQEDTARESVEYAESMGFGSKKEYLEARKSRGAQMVADARAKYLERQEDKYGSDHVEGIGGVDSNKWRAGLNSDTRDV